MRRELRRTQRHGRSTFRSVAHLRRHLVELVSTRTHGGGPCRPGLRDSAAAAVSTSRRRTRLGERVSCSRVCPSGTLATQPRIGGPGWLGPGASRWTKQKATRVLPAEYDQGKASLDALIDWEDANAQGAKRNEATTRLHLIDQLLIEVLRWPRHVVRVEEPSGSGRIDYSLGAPAAQFIVEAKREGDTFDLPAGVRTGVHSIESLTDRPSGRSLRQAMIQVSEYAAQTPRPGPRSRPAPGRRAVPPGPSRRRWCRPPGAGAVHTRCPRARWSVRWWPSPAASAGGSATSPAHASAPGRPPSERTRPAWPAARRCRPSRNSLPGG